MLLLPLASAARRLACAAASCTAASLVLGGSIGFGFLGELKSDDIKKPPRFANQRSATREGLPKAV